MNFWKTNRVKRLKRFMIFAIILWFIVSYVIGINTVPSGSMEPAIDTGDIIVSFKGAYLFNTPERGDIITFYHEEPIFYGEGVKKLLVKRVIGLPGDEIRIQKGKVYINNELLQEDYLPDGTKTIDYKEFYKVPDGHYFVLGDNRENSADSRDWLKSSYVSEEDIVAKLLVVIPKRIP